MVGADASLGRAAFSAEHFHPNADFVLTFSAPRPSEMYSAAYAEKNEQPFVLLGYQPRPELMPAAAGRAAARDILFIAETSGARTPQDLTAQRQAISLMVAALNDNDRVMIAAADVNLVRLNSEWLAPQASGIDAALETLKSRVPLGALDLGSCIHDAAQTFPAGAATRERRIIFIGSGVPALGVLDGAQIAATGAAELNQAHASLVAVSLGRTVDALALAELSRRSNGCYLPLKVDEGFDSAAFQLGLSLQSPLLQSPIVKCDAAVLNEIYPANLGALLPGQEIFLHSRVAAANVSALNVGIAGQFQNAAYERTYKVTLPPTEKLAADPAVGRFWSRARLDHLLAKPQDANTRAEVIELAKTWTLMSPYTSFLVLESNEDYKRYDIDRSKRRPAWKDLDVAGLAPIVPLETRTFRLAWISPNVPANDLSAGRQSLIDVLTKVKGSQGTISFEKRSNALVVRDTSKQVSIR